MRTRLCSTLPLYFCLGFLTLVGTCVSSQAQTTAPGQWTWMGGSDIVDQPGVYGMLEASAPANVPGSRFDASSFTDANGHLWLFGGCGYDTGGTFGELNDLWEFDPSTSEWTWKAGSGTANQLSV